MRRLEQIPGTARLADSALQIVSHRLEKLREFAHSIAERDKDDVEAVHQTRVYCRRVQAAAEVFSTALPSHQVRRLRKRLKRIRNSAGRIRDMDVLAIELRSAMDELDSAERPAAENWLDKYPTKRARKREKLGKKVAKLEKKGFWDWVRKHYPAGNPDPDAIANGEPSLGDLAREQLPVELNSFLAVLSPAPREDYEQLHAVRIAAKRFRYALEAFAGCFPPEFRKQIYNPIKRIQESLGAINDSHNFAQAFGELGDSTEDSRLRESFMALRGRYRRRLEQLSGDFNQLWTEDQRHEYSDRFHAMLKTLDAPDAEPIGNGISLSSAS